VLRNIGLVKGASGVSLILSSFLANKKNWQRGTNENSTFPSQA
jgi:hypothetical protein